MSSYGDNEENSIDNEIEQTDEPVKIKVNDFTKSKKTDLVHFLPCQINYDGFAPVSTFFEPTIRPDTINENYLLSSFRGKLFRGKKIDLKLQIVELEKLNQTELAEQEKNLTKLSIISSETIKNYHVWEFDKFLPENNNLANIQKILSDLNVLN
jgi:hypothetical protein